MRAALTQLKYYFLRFVRTPDILFYTFGLPLILASLYFFASSSLIEGDIEAVPIGVTTESTPFYSYGEILSDIEVLDVTTMSEEEGRELLEAEEIEVYVKQDGNLLMNESNLNTSIVKSIMDQVKQTTAMGLDALNMDYTTEFVKMESTPGSYIVIMFFGLIAMVSLYGGFYGVQISTEILAPLSSLASRLSSTPLKRYRYIGLNALNAVLVNFAANIILIIYIQYVLGIQVVNHFGYSLLLIFLGNIFGIMLGIIVGLIPKLKIDGKTQIVVASTLILTFIAGGMVPGVKQFVNNTIPWFNTVNPVNIITENFYRINLLNDTTILSQGILIMAVYIILMFAFSVYYLRGKRYDHL